MQTKDCHEFVKNTLIRKLKAEDGVVMDNLSFHHEASWKKHQSMMN